MNFRGTIKHLSEIKDGDGAKGKWAKIEILVEEQKDQYPQKANFSYYRTGDDVKFVNDFAKYNPIGTLVDVEFNIKANEYQGKYYTDLSVWKITKVEGNATGVTNANVANPAIPVEDEYSLPF